LIFWSKSPHTKAEHIAANKERDIKVRAHQLHMRMGAEQEEKNSKSTGHAESVDPEAGLDQDAGSQIGRQKQIAKQILGDKSRQLRGMRARVRFGRRRARRRGRSLGF